MENMNANVGIPVVLVICIHSRPLSLQGTYFDASLPCTGQAYHLLSKQDSKSRIASPPTFSGRVLVQNLARKKKPGLAKQELGGFGFTPKLRLRLILLRVSTNVSFLRPSETEKPTAASGPPPRPPEV